MAHVRTTVEILNNNLSKIAEVKNLYPLNREGMILRYSRELSDYGFCTFRISTKDPVFTQLGDIVVPHSHHVRIKRGNVIVWQGAIVDNTERNHNYIEVKAAEYLFYFDKVLIRRDKDNPTTSEDESNFKVFNSGTMASAVQTVVTNALADMGSSHALSGLTVGTIENPNYPANFSDTSSPPQPLRGAWHFSSDVSLQFDYHSAYYVLKMFGLYSGADFELTPDLVFNFKARIGNPLSGITFTYKRIGSNIIDYNIPRLGSRMVNDIIGIAADDLGNILHDTTNAGRNTVSVNTYGLLQEARAYSDVKSKNMLAARLNEESCLVSDPEESPINVVLDEKGYPLGQYDLGDMVWMDIEDGIISYRKERRIVGFTVNVHDTGRELTTIQTNNPPDDLKGAS